MLEDEGGREEETAGMSSLYSKYATLPVVLESSPEPQALKQDEMEVGHDLPLVTRMTAGGMGDTG